MRTTTRNEDDRINVHLSFAAFSCYAGTRTNPWTTSRMSLLAAIVDVAAGINSISFYSNDEFMYATIIARSGLIVFFFCFFHSSSSSPSDFFFTSSHRLRLPCLALVQKCVPLFCSRSLMVCFIILMMCLMHAKDVVEVIVCVVSQPPSSLLPLIDFPCVHCFP